MKVKIRIELRRDDDSDYNTAPVISDLDLTGVDNNEELLRDMLTSMLMNAMSRYSNIPATVPSDV